MSFYRPILLFIVVALRTTEELFVELTYHHEQAAFSWIILLEAGGRRNLFINRMMLITLEREPLQLSWHYGINETELST